MSTDADSLYQPPRSDVSRPASPGDGGGSIDAALAGEVDIRIGDVMGEAWRLVKGSKGVLVLAAIIYGAVAIAPMLIAIAIDPTLAQQTDEPDLTLNLISWTSGFIAYPLMGGIMLYSIKRAASDESAGLADIFRPYSKLVPLIGLYFLQLILIFLGFVALILPGIYLAIAYLLAIPLLLDKELGVWEALETSRKAITKLWFRFFFLVIAVSILAYFGSLLTLLIGGIWLGPWAMLCTGVTYYKLFGHGPEHRRAAGV